MVSEQSDVPAARFGCLLFTDSRSVVPILCRYADENVVVDLRNPLQILPEVMVGKPYKFKHKGKRMGFSIVYDNTSQIKLNRFKDKWENVVNKFEANDSAFIQSQPKFMAISYDGLWYRVVIDRKFEPVIFSQKRPLRLKTSHGQSPHSLTLSYSAQIIPKKRFGTVCSGSSLSSTKYTVFCRNVFDHLHAVTQDALVRDLTKLVESTLPRSESDDLLQRRRIIQQQLTSARIGLLCVISHDMSLPLNQQLAGLLLYKCHVEKATQFIELVCCIVPPRHAHHGIGSKLVHILKAQAKAQKYRFIAVRVQDYPVEPAATGWRQGTTSKASLTKEKTKFHSSEAFLIANGFSVLSGENATLGDQFRFESWVVADDTMQQTLGGGDHHILWKKLHGTP